LNKIKIFINPFERIKRVFLVLNRICSSTK
jgi:hypothetical protein